MPLTEFTGTSEADIEDMFDPTWYAKLLTLSGIKTNANLPAGSRVVKRIEAALGTRYDHFQPANQLLAHLASCSTRSTTAVAGRRRSAWAHELGRPHR